MRLAKQIKKNKKNQTLTFSIKMSHTNRFSIEAKRDHSLLGVAYLNENGPHRPTESGTIRRYSLVGVGMNLLEDVCH